MKGITIGVAMQRITPIPYEEEGYFADQLIRKPIREGHYLVRASDACEHVYYCKYESPLKMNWRYSYENCTGYWF